MVFKCTITLYTVNNVILNKIQVMNSKIGNLTKIDSSIYVANSQIDSYIFFSVGLPCFHMLYLSIAVRILSISGRQPGKNLYIQIFPFN